MDQLFNAIMGRLTGAIQAKYDNFIELAPFILGALTVFILGLILAESVTAKAFLKELDESIDSLQKLSAEISSVQKELRH